MSTEELILALAGAALVGGVVYGVSRMKGNTRARAKVPGAEFEVDTTIPPPAPGIRAKNIKGRNVLVDEAMGHGIDADGIDARGDVILRDEARNAGDPKG